MNRNNLFIILAAGLLLAMTEAQGQKEKKPNLPPGSLFFTLKGQPFALEQVVPGVQGALLLTGEQKAKLADALVKTIWSEGVKSAGAFLKINPEASQPQKDAAHKIIADARSLLSREVAETLSPEQKSLIQQINSAASEAFAAARKDLEQEFSAAKGDKFRMEELNSQLRKEAQKLIELSLLAILTSDQREGMESAAQAQRAASERAGKKGK